MKEDFLHYVWQYQLFNTVELSDIEGNNIEIIHLGEHNHNAGPDFFNAKIKAGDTLWVGNVEIHIHSSDWEKHQHSSDEAYKSVILHVVYHHDKEIPFIIDQKIPTLEVAPIISERLLEVYEAFLKSKKWIACQDSIQRVDAFTISHWLDRLLVERLASKTASIEEELSSTENNWSEVTYVFLARSFGASVNTESFFRLARSLPLKVLAKHKNNLLQIESLLFGMSGLLNETTEDEHEKSLLKEFEFLKHKYQLQPLEKESWKFSRLRPANFPTIRLAQLAGLIFKSKSLFSKLLELETPKQFQEIFNEVSTSEYWDKHYTFGKSSKTRKKRLGEKTINSILINTVAPLIFVYGEKQGSEELKNRALKLLEQLPAEENTIVENWRKLGLKFPNADRSQALIQLKTKHCALKNCLNCGIGNAILQKESS